MVQLLILGSCVLIICILSNKLTNRFGIPMLLAFILLGMIFGSEGLFKIPFDDFRFAENICTAALICIIFYGGFGTSWSAARPAAGKALLLSSAGTLITALITGFLCHWFLHFDLLESLLIGAVLCSTDAASVFYVLRSRNLSLKYHADSLLEIESGSNDPFAYTLTLILLSVIQAGSAVSGWDILRLAVSQILLGLLAGGLVAYAARWFLETFSFEISGFDAVFVLAVSMLAYALPGAVGGNGYLSAYLVGIILGNSPIRNKKGLVNFFDGLTSLMQMVIFFMLGLLSFPSRIAAVWFPALFIALFLTFLARPLAIALLLTPLKVSFRQQAVLSWAGLRGAASIVFAITVSVSGASLAHDLFHIVFCVVLLSLLLQGTPLPWFSRKTGMINESGNVLTTFNDYTEEMDVHYISLPIRTGHPWTGRAVHDLNLPPETLLVFLKRTGKNILPRGDTVIQEGDVLVLSALAYTDQDDIQLKEISLTPDHRWCGKAVHELDVPKNALIILIRRGEETIIPDGKTRLNAGDMVVLDTVS